ncbi:NYN domain-containing protein [Vibrio atlanticus]|uniref:NYN domain-containing protein n=1 Tax=Vibrio atlanticus TaxID=693153 RepID=A0ABV4KP95_9VIBR
MGSRKIAVLIDSENTPHSKLSSIIEELSRYGQIIVKRAYGDFSTEQLKNWKQPLNELAIQAKQQFAYTTGKNSTDALMIIDAMDLLYSQRFDAFALISSDSDFTSLATRLRV